MKIVDFLSVGERDAVSLEELAISTGLPERAVKAEVLRARCSGDLIISTQNGYFLPESSDDIRRFVATRKAVIKTANRALRPFIREIANKAEKGV